jgi:hypothetical protein
MMLYHKMAEGIMTGAHVRGRYDRTGELRRGQSFFLEQSTLMGVHKGPTRSAQVSSVGSAL